MHEYHSNWQQKFARRVWCTKPGGFLSPRMNSLTVILSLGIAHSFWTGRCCMVGKLKVIENNISFHVIIFQQVDLTE